MKLYTVKDLINIGIFSVLYLFGLLIVGLFGVINILLIPFGLIIATLINGITYVLFVTRINHFGMIILWGLIFVTPMIIGGHSWYTYISVLIFATIADIVLYLGKYKNKINIFISYPIFTLWYLGAFSSLYFQKNDMINKISQKHGVDFANKVASFYTDKFFILLVLIILLSGLIGSFIGHRMLNKHFKKAGIA